MKLGSLCSGYEGLGMAVQAVIPEAELAWVSDIDQGACKVLAHRYPDVPNLGDFTKTDWATVEPVEVLTAGFPCQPVSGAGKQLGDMDERWLWDDVARAIGELGPGLVVLENVRGLLTAGSGRLFGRVLGTLADLGYDAQWTGLRAAEVGAPHGRWRVFIVAHPHSAGRREQRWPVAARPEHTSLEHQGSLLPTPRTSDTNGAGQHGDGGLDLRTAVSLLPTPAVNDMGEGKTIEAWDAWTARMKAEHSNGNGHGPSLAIEAMRLLPTPRTQNNENRQSEGYGMNLGQALGITPLDKEDVDVRSTEDRPGQVLRDVRGGDDPQEVCQWEARGQDGVPQAPSLLTELREHEDGPDALGLRMEGAQAHEGVLPGVWDQSSPACAPQRPELGEQRPGEPGDVVRVVSPETSLAGGPLPATGGQPVVAWGPYEAAIRRWEGVLGRPAPPPTELGPKGSPRLSAAFSEFLMGLPAGHVTDVPGITRNEALKLCGNGVVPQQGAAAIALLLDRAFGTVAA